MHVSDRGIRFGLKPLVFVASLGPLAYVVWAAAHHLLGRDPFRGAIRETGVWSLRFLYLTIAVTLVRRATSWHAVIRFRRMLGLFAFFYGALHAALYVVDQASGFYFEDAAGWWQVLGALGLATRDDIVRRPFIALGWASLVIMAPLAVTSTPAMIRRLGGRRWRHLHLLVYVAAVAGLLHHWWPPGDRLRLDSYGVIIGGLVAYRIYRTMLAPPLSPGGAPLRSA